MSEKISYTLPEISFAKKDAEYVRSGISHTRSVFSDLFREIYSKLNCLISIHEQSFHEINEDIELLEEVIEENEDYVSDCEDEVDSAQDELDSATEETRATAKRNLSEAKAELKQAKQTLDKARQLHAELKSQRGEYLSAVSRLISDKKRAEAYEREAYSACDNAHRKFTDIIKFADDAYGYAAAAITNLKKTVPSKSIPSDVRVDISNHQMLYYASQELKDIYKSTMEIVADMEESSDAFIGEGKLRGSLASSAVNKADELCEIFAEGVGKFPEKANGLFLAYGELCQYLNLK